MTDIDKLFSVKVVIEAHGKSEIAAWALLAVVSLKPFMHCECVRGHCVFRRLTPQLCVTTADVT